MPPLGVVFTSVYAVFKKFKHNYNDFLFVAGMLFPLKGGPLGKSSILPDGLPVPAFGSIADKDIEALFSDVSKSIVRTQLCPLTVALPSATDTGDIGTAAESNTTDASCAAEQGSATKARVYLSV